MFGPRSKWLLASVPAVAAIGWVLGAGGPAPAAQLQVAVFNFEMTSDTPGWKWLEKGLADRITTDFTRSRRIVVSARDEMQVLASKLRWVPEMATADEAAMARIREAMKIDHLVTGVYKLDGERIEITAQIVEVEGRKEVARRTVRGAVADVMTLQKQLSAELLSWFSGVKAEQILPHLPVWTQSIPATTALYEGMHLYDQGRYEEAWMKFRQSLRNDPTYLEAAYWVARMYYFMDRYEHARRAYEQFVYRDSGHPRVGDAIKEYLHTWEKLGTPPQTLLRLYDDLGRRYPQATIYNELGLPFPVDNLTWLQIRGGQVLSQIGRSREATVVASEAAGRLSRHSGWMIGWPYRVAMRASLNHNQQSGEVLVPPGLETYARCGRYSAVLRFTTGQTERTFRLPAGARVFVSGDEKSRTRYGNVERRCLLVAPDGHVFRSLRVWPLVEGHDGKVIYNLGLEAITEAGLASMSLPQAVKQGCLFDDIPRSGMFCIGLQLLPNDPLRDPRLRFYGIRVVAELEPVGPHGSLEVSCPSLLDTVVRIDGRASGSANRLIGLIPPGEHSVTVGPRLPMFPFDECSATVRVERDRTVRLEVALPWKPDSPWAVWPHTIRIAREEDYGAQPCLQSTEDPPAILADAESIRVVWSRHGDLWWARSTDGHRFSPPQKIPMPVSTGWLEQHPVCVRDESGRFILAFLSDREGQHQMRAYLCWSRDGEHWSRPAMVADRTVHYYRIIPDQRGGLLWADATNRRLTVLRSKDGYRWERLAQWDLSDSENGIGLLQREDGTYGLFCAVAQYATEARHWMHSSVIATVQYSRDGVTWSPAQKITQFVGQTNSPLFMCPLYVSGQTILSCFGRL